MYRHCLQIAPNFISEHFYISNALLLQSRFHEALAEADREQEDSARFAGRALALYALHQQHESDAALRKFIEVTGLEWASEVARVYAFRGEREQALTWLDKAFQQRDPDLYFIKGDPLLKNLEGDPRYKAFLRKMNLPD
jgi:tetratricopeptide (TPR) repeat protein